MRHKFLALAIVAACAAPLAATSGAQAQQRIIVEEGVTTGMAAPQVGVIAQPQLPRFRQYIVEERVPSYAVDAPIAVGTVLPDAGVTYYDVPQEYGATSYRYTVVNDHSILVDPHTRRVMQVIE